MGSRKTRGPSRRWGWAPGPALLVVLVVALGVVGTAVGMEVPEADAGPAMGAPMEPLAPVGEPPAVLRNEKGQGPASGFQDARARFSLRMNDLTVPYRVMAVTALPGETLNIRVALEDGAGTLSDGVRDGGPGFVLTDGTGQRRSSPDGDWSWKAPENPGVHPVRVHSPAHSDSIHLNVLVLHPRSEIVDGALNGYEIGEYRIPAEARREGLEPPEGFVEVGPDEKDVLVSPHFTLEQFLCKQPGSPRYLALSEPLVLKLEAILEAVNDAGIPAPSLHVMSGFRTPHYNRSIGNRTDLSRHLWGDAADVFIDMEGNGRMDDLTGSGQGDRSDAELLYRIIESVQDSDEPHVRQGGLSLYPANAVRGPFIHVDARGERARW